MEEALVVPDINTTGGLARWWEAARRMALRTPLSNTSVVAARKTRTMSVIQVSSRGRPRQSQALRFLVLP
jgi:hypothetical protein